MHTIKKYKLKEINEYEINFCGKYGLKGECRGSRKKATPEQIKKINQKNKTKLARRTMMLNFNEGDLFCTMKYPQGTRKPLDEVKKDFSKFCRRMRQAYQKIKAPFKYMYRIEIGSRGGIHIHMILNRVKELATDLLVQEKWTEGRVNFQSVYEDDGFEKLANYLTKEPEEDSEAHEQLMLFEKDDRKKLLSIGSSRNLERPVPEIKEYSRRGVRDIVDNGPTATPGYYIVQDSVVIGVNPFTGYSYIHYTERRLKNNVFERKRTKKTG